MNPQEYLIYIRKYAALQGVPADTDLDSIVRLQDAALRAFVQEPGYERLWEEETETRIVRQATLARLPRHHAK